MLHKNDIYIPRKDRDDYEEPTGYIVIKCHHNWHSNFLDQLAGLLVKHVATHGTFDNNVPPLITKEFEVNLGRRLPNVSRFANKKNKSTCICDKLRPAATQLHVCTTVRTRSGRERHLIQSDTKLLRPYYPKLAAVLDLPTTFVPNLPKQHGDLHDILNRMLAKLNEWAMAVAPEATEEYKEWIKPFHTAALDSIAKGHQTKPTIPDPAPDGWEEEYRQATRDGLAISTCDKSNGFVYMCSCLPPAMLEMQVDVPERYTRAPVTPKMVFIKHKKAFRRIYGEDTPLHSDLPIINPTVKHHKPKKDNTHPYIEWKFRTVTSYKNRGCANQQLDLSNILAEVENFHHSGYASHVVTSSVDFNMKLKRNIKQHATADVVGMFDALDSEYATHALSTLLQEMYTSKQSQLGPHAHIRLLPNGRVRWSKDRPNKKDSRHFPVTKVQYLIRYLLKNDFISACGTVWKSVTGVPMGGNAASRISSLTAYFAEREPLAQIKRDIAGAQFFRYADDIYYTFDEFTFNLYFAGAYAAAGFTLEHERGKGITRAINYLETTIHLPRPTDVDQDAWTTHYSKKQELFPQDRSLPHRGSASSVSGQKQQLANLVRRTYHNTSRIVDFVRSIHTTHIRHPEYPRRDIVFSVLSILNNTRGRSRFDLHTADIKDLRKCLYLMHTKYVASRTHTHILR